MYKCWGYSWYSCDIINVLAILDICGHSQLMRFIEWILFKFFMAKKTKSTPY